MQFKSEVTIGTVLSTLAMLGAGTAAWSDSQSKIVQTQVEIHNLKEADKRLEQNTQIAKEDIIKRLDELRADFKDIKTDVREIRNEQRR